MTAEAIPLARVYTSATLVNPDEPAWTEQPHLIAQSLVTGQAPTIDQASLLWRAGNMKRESNFGSDSTHADVSLLDIKGQFVRIEVDEYDLIWYGYVTADEIYRGPDVSDGAGGLKLAYGDQTFTAVGLEWFLSRVTIHSSVLNNVIDGSYSIDRAIGFNAGMGDGRSVAYDKRANRVTGPFGFFSDNPDDVELWTAYGIAEYLLIEQGPKDAAGLQSPVLFELHPNSTPYLDWFHPTVSTEGRSVWQVLNDIISHARGLTWKLVVDLGVFLNEFHVYLTVDSQAATAVSLPGGATLPANSNIVDLGVLDNVLDQVMVRRDISRRYDHVICRGARRRAVFTVSFESENLEEGWRPTDETDYKAALGTDPAANDRFRQAHRFERVYQVFQIPSDWDGASNDGSGPPTNPACPQPIQGSLSVSGATPICMPGLRLLRTMPLKVGYDYADATAPTSRDPADTSPEFMKPFAVIDVSEDSSGAWRFTRELSMDEDGFKSFDMYALDGMPGLQFNPPDGMPHALALNHFDPAPDGPDGETDHLPLVDYERLRCTVAAEWDAYCEGRYPLPDGAGEPLTTLYIQIGERARHDWLADETIYDVENGTLKIVGTGGALRDDRELCVQIAQIAYEWYGVERSEFSLTTMRQELPAPLGALISTIGSGATLETINAVVSQITYDFQSGRLTLSAGFSELDFAALA